MPVKRRKGAVSTLPTRSRVDEPMFPNVFVLSLIHILPRLREGDILAALDAGAYGYVMASTYNSRLRPAEVLIGEDGAARLIRRRETLEDLASTLLCSLN